MSKVQPGRFTAQPDGDVVVFIIGMRINKLHKVHKWVPVSKEMGPMVRELMQQPDKGLLGAKTFVSGRVIMLVQYWKDYESLERFARDRDDLHLPAWRRFNKRVGTDGTVGIFHETYMVPAGAFETIYVNMPSYGLAQATNNVPVAKLGQSSAYRIGKATTDAPAEPVPA